MVLYSKKQTSDVGSKIFILPALRSENPLFAKVYLKNVTYFRSLEMSLRGGGGGGVLNSDFWILNLKYEFARLNNSKKEIGILSSC